MTTSHHFERSCRWSTALTALALVFLALPTSGAAGLTGSQPPPTLNPDCVGANAMNPEAGACWVAVEVGHCNAARVVRIVGGMYYDDCNKSLLSCFSNGTTTVLIQGNNNRLCVTDTNVCSGNDSLTVVIIGNNNRVCEGSGTICSFNAAVTFVSIGANNRYCNNHVHDGTRVVV